ncbi:MAG: propionyl-CoA carboxylase [Alphaproteobacteria bacterium]|nr:propionyl-CoA carboxylase [Alphaproteobacteria bacterium]
MTWKPEIEELERRQRMAEAQGGPEAVARQHARGRLTVRERIAALVDPGSFREVGKLAGNARYAADGTLESVTPATYVMGMAAIDGRPIAIGGEDFTVRGGSSWGTMRRKGGQGGFSEDLAHEYRIPLVNLCDGAGGTVTSIKSRGYSTFPGVFGFERSIELLGEVPVAAAVLGAAAGGPAGRAILSHFSVMVRGTAQVFAAGPPVVKRALGHDLDNEALGGASIAVDKAGTIHNAAASEAEAFQQIRRFLSYLPQNVWEAPPILPCDDPDDRREEGLLAIVPRERKRPYKMRALLGMVVDRDSAFEIQPTHGRAVITALARIGGCPVGVVANDPLVNGGALDARAARKQTHFIELCDTFHLPIVFFVDVPGFMIGPQAEEAATLREGMRAMWAAANLRVPTVAVVIRKCYGMAGGATTGKNGLDYKIGWPSAEWGSLPIEGGVAAGFRREIAAAADPKAREAEIEDDLRRYASPFRTAEAFMVEDVIDPRETRPLLAQMIRLAYGRVPHLLGPRAVPGVGP